MTRVYVAGKFNDRLRIHQLITDEFSTDRFRITHDWTQTEDQVSPSVAALKDIEGVIHADVIVVIMDDPRYSYRGTFTEIGAALALRKRIMIYCPVEDSEAKTNCFFHHPRIEHFNSLDHLLETLKITQISAASYHEL